MEPRLVLAYVEGEQEPRWMDRAEALQLQADILEDTADTAPDPGVDGGAATPEDVDAFLAGGPATPEDVDAFLAGGSDTVSNPQVPNTPKAPGLLATMRDEFAQGATKNWVDEGAGAIVGGDVGDTLTKNMRRDLAAGSEAHPIGAFIANTGGEIASDYLLGKVIPGYNSRAGMIAQGAVSGAGRGESALGKGIGAGVGAGVAAAVPYVGKLAGRVAATPGRWVAKRAQRVIDETLAPVANKAYEALIKPVIKGAQGEVDDATSALAKHAGAEEKIAGLAEKRINALEEAGAVATRKAGDILYPKKVFETLTPEEKLDLAIKKIVDQQEALERSKSGFVGRESQSLQQGWSLTRDAVPGHELNALEKLRADYMDKSLNELGHDVLNRPLPAQAAEERFAAEAADLARKRATLEGKAAAMKSAPAPSVPQVTPEQKALAQKLLNDPDWLRVHNPKLWQKIQADVPQVGPKPVVPEPAPLPLPLGKTEQELAHGLKMGQGGVGGEVFGAALSMLPGVGPAARWAARKTVPSLVDTPAGNYARAALKRQIGTGLADVAENETKSLVKGASRQLRPEELQALAEWLMEKDNEPVR